MQEDYRDGGGLNFPVNRDRGDETTGQGERPGGKSPAERHTPADGSDPEQGDEPEEPQHWSVRWLDLVALLAIIGVAAILVTVGHLSPSDLAAYGAVVTSIYAAWIAQRPARQKRAQRRRKKLSGY
jgi:hypothetical protein